MMAIDAGMRTLLPVQIRPPALILFVSDMHFGRPGSREAERSLIACLRSCEQDVERLYLVGDVFDQYIEYRHLVPKGAVRFQGLLAEWVDGGLPVVYFLGNHDPWHSRYFSEEIGVTMVADSLTEQLYGSRVYMRHGDGIGPDTRAYRFLKPWLRHPAPVWLYRNLLPGDAGMALAAYARSRVAAEEVSEVTVQALRQHAREVLARPDIDAVIMGHSHYPEWHRWPEGEYINTGSWYDTRTLSRLSAEGWSLLRWEGGRLKNHVSR